MASVNGLTNFAENKVIDALWRGQAIGVPANYFFALIRGKLATNGKWAASTAYASGDIVAPTAHNGRLWRCSTAGTTGASEPSWVLTDGATTADNTAVWTELTPDLDAGTNLVEVSGGAYARVSYAGSLANFAGTQSAGSTTASSGTGGQTSNNAAITFPAPTADWGPAVAVLAYDASSAGNPWHWVVMTTPQQILNGQAAPSIAVGNWVYTLS
jgi:hypothetical protein